MDKKEISVPETLWQNAMRVQQSDLIAQQNHNNQIDSATINNHFGSGVLLNQLNKKVIFDSSKLNTLQQNLKDTNMFDGVGLSPHDQPTDLKFGSQLEVILTDSNVFGRFSVKVAIIGLDFNGNLQSDTFYFFENEKQVTSKHYIKVLSILCYDFYGNFISRNLGGKLVIQETDSLQLSKECIMVSQDTYPSLFWRDFKRNGTADLSQVLQNAIGPEYNVDGLNINITGITSKQIDAEDVTSHVGQKFVAKTNNIQKITLLLGASTNGGTYDWDGDLIVSVYPLQTEVASPSDILPELPIEFSPSSQPLVQISYSQQTLKEIGYQLNDVLQPVDFVFSSTKIGKSGGIVVGQHYAITVKRSGAANSGTILLGAGLNSQSDYRLTLYNNVWVDIPEESLWFQVWTDAAKISDGMGYDNGIGVTVAKTKLDSNTGSVIDNQNKYYSLFSTSENTLNTAVIQAVEEDSFVSQNERTGSKTYIRKQMVPSLNFVGSSQLTQLKKDYLPLIVGAAQDFNPKKNITLTKVQTYPGTGMDDEFIVINPDSDLLTFNLVGSKLKPNILNSKEYKIYKQVLYTDYYGDVNGDGVIDSLDVIRATQLLNYSLSSSVTRQKIIDGEVSTLEILRADVDGDGTVTSTDIDLITQYVNKEISSFSAGTYFRHLLLKVQQNLGRYDYYYDCTNGRIRLDGVSSQNIINVGDVSVDNAILDGYIFDQSIQSDPAYSTTGFSSVTYQIIPQLFWQNWMMMVNDQVRLVPASFIKENAIVPYTDPTVSLSTDKSKYTPAVDAGRNDAFLPGHVYLDGGQILNKDGSYYKVDFEVGNIILELPIQALVESNINIFEKFVSEYNNTGLTAAKYKAMKYADGSFVQPNDLAYNRIRFTAAIQSIAKNTDGYSEDDGYGIILDDIFGVLIDYATGILTLNVQNLSIDPIYLTLVTKIQITVYLKKGGWNNSTVVVGSSEIAGLIS